MKVLIIENGYNDLVKSRFPLGNFFISKGLSVCYSCPNPPLNSDTYNLEMNRSKLAILSILKSLIKLKKIESNEGINAVMSFRLTSNILNYFSSFFGKRKKRVAVITGLGYAFVNSNIMNKVRRLVIAFFYRVAEKRMDIITQNPDDLMDLGLKAGKVILGSGVRKPKIVVKEKNDFSHLKLLYVGRLLKSKGVDEAINTFKALRASGNNVKLAIAGDIDSNNPDSISLSELNRIKMIEDLNYLGHVQNMEEVYQDSDILVFPSIYREGIPRVIIEAMSFGLTIVTKNVPGCKETILNNGYLVQDNFVVEAKNYISYLSNAEIKDNFKQSLKLHNDKFSEGVVFQHYLNALF